MVDKLLLFGVKHHLIIRFQVYFYRSEILSKILRTALHQASYNIHCDLLPGTLRKGNAHTQSRTDVRHRFFGCFLFQ